jgi:hypothetical protein
MKTGSKQARPIRPEDISQEDFSTHLTMLRWLARNQPEKTGHGVFLTIKEYYDGFGGPRLRKGGAQ